MGKAMPDGYGTAALATGRSDEDGSTAAAIASGRMMASS
jgi:hypothetical protein